MIQRNGKRPCALGLKESTEQNGLKASLSTGSNEWMVPLWVLEKDASPCSHSLAQLCVAAHTNNHVF